MLISGNEIIAGLKAKIKKEIERAHFKPIIIFIYNEEDKPSSVYAKNFRKIAEQNNFGFYLKSIDSNTSEVEIKNIITDSANNDDIDGILITRPFVARFKQEFLNLIPVWKDLDGVTDSNISALFKGLDGLFPATPLAVMQFINEVGYSLKGKKVVIIGRSNIVGKPLVHMLLREDATVTICHTKTADLKSELLSADVLISAAGHPGLVTVDMVKEGTFVIDVGISVVEGKILGDVDMEKVQYRAAFLTPVPGGVGPVTNYMLLLNTIKGMKARGKLPE